MSEEFKPGEEIVYDVEDEHRGVSTVGCEVSSFFEGGVCVEVDCDRCLATHSLEVPWSEVAILYQGGAVANMKRSQSGSVGAAICCHECLKRFANLNESDARRNSTVLVWFSPPEIADWVSKGVAFGKIDRTVLAKAKRYVLAQAQQRQRQRTATVAPVPQAPPQPSPSKGFLSRLAGGTRRK